MDNDKAQAIKAMSSLFNNIAEILNNENAIDDIESAQKQFFGHVEANLIINIKNEIYLPVPIFLYINPTMEIQFLLHIMLSMGLYDTDIGFISRTSLR